MVYFASWNYWAYSKWGLKDWSYGTCSGTETAALTGMGVLSSYLVLFLIFYQNTYKKTKNAVASAYDSKAKKANGKSH